MTESRILGDRKAEIIREIFSEYQNWTRFPSHLLSWAYHVYSYHDFNLIICFDCVCNQIYSTELEMCVLKHSIFTPSAVHCILNMEGAW